jgi:hypothetical protein
MILTAFIGITPELKAQCVENHSGYSAAVSWYRKSDIEFAKKIVTAGFVNIPALAATLKGGIGPVHEANVNNNVGAENSRECYGSGYVVVVKVRGGIYSKIAIWAAIAVGVGMTCVAVEDACDLAWEAGYAGGQAATTNIPDAKTAIFASEVPSGKAVILRGLTTTPRILLAKLDDFNRTCTASNAGYACYKDNDDRGTCKGGLCVRN